MSTLDTPGQNLNRLDQLTKDEANEILDLFEQNDEPTSDAINYANSAPAITLLKLVAIAQRAPKSVVSPSKAQLESFAIFALPADESIEVACHMLHFIGLEKAIEYVKNGSGI